MAKSSKNPQFYSQKWPTKTATILWRCLLRFGFLLSQFHSLFLPCFSLFPAVSWRLGTPKQPAKWGYMQFFLGACAMTTIRKSQKTRQSTVQEVNGGQSWLSSPPIMALKLRTRPPPTGVKIAKIGKRGFRGQKTPISQCPRNGRFEWRNGDFLTQSARFWGTGKWEFFDPETLFSRFGDFDPCRGRTRSQH